MSERCRDAARAAGQTWSQRYQACDCVGGSEASQFLVEHLPLLARGAALDVAMGEGRNALFLARQGFQVTGVEREPLAIERALTRCAQEGLSIQTVEADLEEGWVPARQTFDLVVVINYLQRDLFGALQAALRPGGALVYEGTTVDHQGSLRPQFRLQPRELLSAFPALDVRVYRESQGRAGLVAMRVKELASGVAGLQTQP